MKSIVTLLLLVLFSGSSCAVWEAHHRAISAAESLPPAAEAPQPRERWHETYVIEKEGNCELICRRYGNHMKCEKYRCP